MALKAETKTKLKALGLDVDKLITAITAEAETEYEVPEVSVFTPEQLEARDANKLTEGKKAGEVIGEQKGKDLAAKALKKKFGIEDEATKDLDKVVDAVNAKVATGDTGLKQQVEGLLRDKETLAAEVQAKGALVEQIKFDSDLLAHFPVNRGTGMTDAERLMIIKANFQFEKAEGKVVVKRDGEILKDKTTHAPIPVKQALSDYFTERSWIGTTNPGGRGGHDNPPPGGGSGFKKLSQVQDQWVKDNPGKNPVSDEFQAHLAAVTKDVPDFDYYT